MSSAQTNEDKKVLLLEARDARGESLYYTCQNEQDARVVSAAFGELERQIDVNAVEYANKTGGFDPSNKKEHQRGLDLANRLMAGSKSDKKNLRKFAMMVEAGVITLEHDKKGNSRFFVTNKSQEISRAAHGLMGHFGIQAFDAEVLQVQEAQKEERGRIRQDELDANNQAIKFINERVKRHAAENEMTEDAARDELKKLYYKGEEGGIPGKWVRGTDKLPKSECVRLTAEQRNAWVESEIAQEAENTMATKAEMQKERSEQREEEVALA